MIAMYCESPGGAGFMLLVVLWFVILAFYVKSTIDYRIMAKRVYPGMPTLHRLRCHRYTAIDAVADPELRRLHLRLCLRGLYLGLTWFGIAGLLVFSGIGDFLYRAFQCNIR